MEFKSDENLVDRIEEFTKQFSMVKICSKTCGTLTPNAFNTQNITQREENCLSNF